MMVIIIITSMKKVLVVEDNPLNMELVLEILKSQGFSAFEAVDGEDAIHQIEKETFDLVLMDIELPGIDGMEVTRIIKTKYGNIPIIALTSYAMKGDKEKFLAAGFDEYMSKPIDLLQFMNRLEKYRK